MEAIKHDIAFLEAVAKPLLYSDIFNYPLKLSEIHSFSASPGASLEDVRDALDTLIEQGLVFKHGDYYDVHDSKANVKRRIEGNQRAQAMAGTAHRQAQLIMKFPFVRSVMASGSFSKNFMDENSDLDFFVVTVSNRLWIARMMLVIYKKLFLKNSHQLFCVNYFVDTEHLVIEEQNIFTATELATLIPLAGDALYHRLMAENLKWLKAYFPNLPERNTSNKAEAVAALKRLGEKILRNTIGDWLDRLFMHVTLNRWKRKYSERFCADDFNIAFKTSRHVSKGHPNYYQKKVIALLQQKLDAFRRRL